MEGSDSLLLPQGVLGGGLSTMDDLLDKGGELSDNKECRGRNVCVSEVQNDSLL
jgi:hypothetical protein